MKDPIFCTDLWDINFYWLPVYLRVYVYVHSESELQFSTCNQEKPCFRSKLEDFLCSEKFTEPWLAADIYTCIRHHDDLLGLWNPRKLWRLTETKARLFSLQRAPGARRRLPQTCQTVSEITQVPPSRNPSPGAVRKRQGIIKYTGFILYWYV